MPTGARMIRGGVFWFWESIIVMGWYDIVFMALSHEDDTGLGTARLYFVFDIIGRCVLLWLCFSTLCFGLAVAELLIEN